MCLSYWVVSSVKAGLYLLFLLYTIQIGAQYTLYWLNYRWVFLTFCYSPFFPKGLLMSAMEVDPGLMLFSFSSSFFTSVCCHCCYKGNKQQLYFISNSVGCPHVTQKSKFLSRYPHLGRTVNGKDYGIKDYYFKKLNSNSETESRVTCSVLYNHNCSVSSF